MEKQYRLNYEPGQQVDGLVTAKLEWVATSLEVRLVVTKS